MRQALCILVAILGFFGIAQSAAGDDLSSSIDAMFADFDSNDVPGCAVGVIRNGEYIHAKGYGSANLEHGIPIGTDTVFRTGSISKQFTAAAIAILASRGDLDLDADVHVYLHDLGKYDDPVTIRQMVHHISGIAEYDGDATETAYEVREGKLFRFGNEDYWTIQEFYQQVATQQQPLARKPGVSYEYSNTAYFLLSQVVERVSGKTLRQFADEEIFGPLQMHDTFFNDNVNGIVVNRAAGYRPLEQGGFEIYMTNLSWVGDGGVYTTLNDFIKWDQAFITGKVPGGMQVQKLMLEPDPVTVMSMETELLDEGAGYGFGLNIGKYKGHTAHMHTGSWVGFRAFYARFPEDDFSVVTLCNRSDAETSVLGRKLLDRVLSEFPR